METKKETLRIKMNLMNVLNQVIDGLNLISEDHPDYKLPRQLMVMDVKFNILIGYMEDIAKRALELDDEKLLAALEGLGVISMREDGLHEQKK